MYIFTQTLCTSEIRHSLTGFNSEFSFSKTGCQSKVKKFICQLFYYSLATGRIVVFIPFQRVLVLCKMQSASSRIWTWVAVSTCYYGNHYTTSASVCTNVRLCCILTFDPAKNAIPKWCTGRNWHIPMAVMRRNRVGGRGWRYGTR